MADATADFFAALAARGHEPLLAKAAATMRVELRSGKRTDRWLVAVHRGDIAVSRGNGEADGTLRARRDVFDRVASGELNAMAAVLRGTLEYEGDPELLVLFQRLFPGPPARSEG